ncbi:MAG: efflux RND transporter permease subunit, partial [Granulosicoccaceae bacterium]
MKGGVIAWFARNHVAANLLMVFVAGLGFYNLQTQMAVEVFPSFTLDRISVRTVYPGASPQEVEEAVTIRVEEALQDLASIEETRSRSTEGSSAISLDLASGEDPRDALDDIKSRIDAITTFPDSVETPSITLAQRKREVISVALSGELSEHELRDLADRVRDELLAKAVITQVEIQSARPYEMAVEISERRLREYGLTLAQVAQAIERGSASAAAGNLRTEGGEVLLRTQGQAYTAREFGDIAILTRADGSQLKVKDIAALTDGFDEAQINTRFNGRSSILIEVYRVGDQSAIDVAAATREYVQASTHWLPAGVSLDTWRDRSTVLRARLNTLLKSALQGGLLVVILLTLFLRPAVAFWVTIGIPVSFLGSFIVLPWLGLTINIVSLFAFILVLGIVVDDAIVTGENIYTHTRRGVPGERAAVEGTLEVATPVTFGVLTTALAFLPLAMVGGVRGQIFAQIPAVVVPVLLFSLVESKFVLPSHLKNLKIREEKRPNILMRVQQSIADGLETLVHWVYKPILGIALRWRLTTVSLFVASLLIAVAVMS